MIEIKAPKPAFYVKKKANSMRELASFPKSNYGIHSFRRYHNKPLSIFMISQSSFAALFL